MEKNRYKVLVLDDVEVVRRVLVNYLTSHGFDTLEANTVHQATTLIVNERPHAASIDLKLNGLNGELVVRFIRKLDLQIPVVIISGYITKESKNRLERLGVRDFFPKPVRLADDRLASTIRREIEETSSRESSRELETVALRPEQVERNKVKALVVGNPHFTKVMAAILPTLGPCQVIPTNTRHEALATLKSEEPSFILLDMDFLGPRGITALKLIRLNRKHENVPLVFVTDRNIEERTEEYTNLGALRCLPKPLKSLEPFRKLIRIFANVDVTTAKETDRSPQSLMRRIEEIEEDLPAIPDVYYKVQELAEDPSASAADLEQVIRVDPGITSKILRLSNSAFFGFRRTIEDLKDAIVLLGTTTVRNLVLTVSVMEASNGLSVQNFSRSDFWRHSIVCGVTAEILSGKLKVQEEHAFTAGILHDIGKMALDCFFPDYLGDIVQVMLGKQISMFEAEKEVMDMTHADVGGAFADKWNFPSRFLETVASHHNPGRSRLSGIVYVADIVSNNLGYSVPNMGRSIGYTYRDTVLESLELKLETIERMLPSIEQEAEKAIGAFLSIL